MIFKIRSFAKYMSKPNILFIMCDQLRADTIASLGAEGIKTPNLDRLVARGVNFPKAYSTCPVCMPARYTIRTGREPYNTGYYENGPVFLAHKQPLSIEERCGEYLAKSLKKLGYFTFGVGKFHADPYDEILGYDVQVMSEELFGDIKQQEQDDYFAFIKKNYPEYSHLEQLYGERTEMYYMPQTSAMPADITAEAWVADNAIRLIKKTENPFFGLVSFIAPHPPFAPPIPYNRMYNPDNMSSPVVGDKNIDHADEQIPFMNNIIWAEDVDPLRAKVLKARYYGEITYVDYCIGRILDEVEQREDADNTLICFFSDHGDHLGDHHAWQKESFFEASTRVPFLLSWPKQLKNKSTCNELVCLTDLFGIATSAAGACEKRDGIDVLGMLKGRTDNRDYIVGIYGKPGTNTFKMMVRSNKYKYIVLANGGRELLFNLDDDPNEVLDLSNINYDETRKLREIAINMCKKNIGLMEPLNQNEMLVLPYMERNRTRIHQFDIRVNNNNFIYP